MNMQSSCLGSQEMPTVALNLVLAEARIYSGQCLEATVLVDSADPETIISDFLAEIRGVGRTGWVNIHTDKIYETEEEYLNMVLTLCTPMLALKPGRHRFQLRVAIPDNVPSSFESQFGSVRYTIKLSLFTNAEHSNAVEMFPFYLIARSYFDDIPNAIMQGIDYRDEIDFTVCSLPFGTVYLRITLPKTAFYLGEIVIAKIHVKNSTRKDVKDCCLQLLLKTQFEARSRYEHANDKKLLEQIVDAWPMGRVKARTEANFEDCNLRVPEAAIPSYYQSLGQAYDSAIPSTSNYGPRNSCNGTQCGRLAVAAGCVLMGGSSAAELFEETRAQAAPQSPNIIALSYVLRFNALPGIETEIPIIITSNGWRQESHKVSREYIQPIKDNEQLMYGNQGALNWTPEHLNPHSSQKRRSIFEGKNGGALYYC